MIASEILRIARETLKAAKNDNFLCEAMNLSRNFLGALRPENCGKTAYFASFRVSRGNTGYFVFVRRIRRGGEGGCFAGATLVAVRALVSASDCMYQGEPPDEGEPEPVKKDKRDCNILDVFEGIAKIGGNIGEQNQLNNNRCVKPNAVFFTMP